MFVFGSGVLIGTQLNVATPTPINFGLVQKVSVDTSVSVKELYGQYAFPIAVGSGTRKVQCKASLARFSGQALGRLFYSQAPTVGSTISQFAEVHAVPATSPYTVTVTNASHFVADQGVIYAATALPLLNVATLTAAGQYTFNASTGVYTFSSGDEGASVLISYSYTFDGGDNSEHRGHQPADRADVDLLGQAVRVRPDDEAQFSVTALQLRRRASSRSAPKSRTSQAGLRLPVLRQRGRPGLPVQLRRRGVSEETFAVSLGGKRWAVPHLPFRAIKAIQPVLFDVYLEAGGPAMSGKSVARLSELQLDRLAEATWRAVSFVDPALSYTEFLDLPFSVGELIQAFPSVARAAGLRAGQN